MEKLNDIFVEGKLRPQYQFSSYLELCEWEWENKKLVDSQNPICFHPRNDNGVVIFVDIDWAIIKTLSGKIISVSSLKSKKLRYQYTHLNKDEKIQQHKCYK
jgi:hypothetical protein